MELTGVTTVTGRLIPFAICVTIIFVVGLQFSKKNLTLKLENQSKEDEISHGRGNSLRNKVRGWV